MIAQVITSVFNALAVYILFWWITLFAVLPWGIRSHISQTKRSGGRQRRGDDDSEAIGVIDPGSPIAPRIGQKLVITSVVSLLLFSLYFIAVQASSYDRYDLLEVHRWMGIYIPEYIQRPQR